MTERLVCPRCGALDSFMKGYLPDTCVCRVCQSQLDYREIRDCGPDCRPVTPGVQGPGPEGSKDASADSDSGMPGQETRSETTDA